MYEGIWTISPCLHRDSSELVSSARGQRDDCSRPRPARVRESGGGARLPRRRPARARPVPARRHGAALSRRSGKPIADGKRICVHGDYDADGICATALAVLVLRELGADVTWHLPSRFEEGYGLRSETLTQLAEEGCGLVLTVDCGITAVEEVAEREVTGTRRRRHRPPPSGRELPDCPVVATRPSDYPFPELCGTGVVYKLGEALLGDGQRRARTPSRPRRSGDDLRRRAAGRREPRAGAGGAARSGANPEARPAGPDEDRPRRSCARRRGRRRLPARPADQRLGPPLPPRGGARAAAHRGRRRRRPARPRARGAEPRAAAGRGPNSPLGRLQGGGVAGGEASDGAATSSPTRTGTKA